MMMGEQVFAQALLLAGEIDARQRSLLRVLCNAWAASLSARLKKGLTVQDCQEAFVAAASLYALADLKQTEEGTVVEEFKAGDLTVRQGSVSREGRSDALQKQAGMLIGPYLADGFAFMGV